MLCAVCLLLPHELCFSCVQRCLFGAVRKPESACLCTHGYQEPHGLALSGLLLASVLILSPPFIPPAVQATRLRLVRMLSLRLSPPRSFTPQASLSTLTPRLQLHPTTRPQSRATHRQPSRVTTATAHQATRSARAATCQVGEAGVV